MQTVYGLRLKINEKELEGIFERLHRAMEEINKCYGELASLGAVTLEKTPCPEEQGGDVTQK